MTTRLLRYCAHVGTELPDAFLAIVWKLRTASAPLPESSRLTSRSSPAPVPLGSTLLSLGLRAARPASRLFFRAHVPFVFFIYTAGIARGELTLRSTTSLHNYIST